MTVVTVRLQVCQDFAVTVLTLVMSVELCLDALLAGCCTSDLHGCEEQ